VIARSYTATSELNGASRSQSGVTLIELMVALTISMILLAAIAGVFLTSRQSYVLDQGLARTQEAGRFAMEFPFPGNDFRVEAGKGGKQDHSVRNMLVRFSTAVLLGMQRKADHVYPPVLPGTCHSHSSRAQRVSEKGVEKGLQHRSVVVHPFNRPCCSFIAGV